VPAHDNTPNIPLPRSSPDAAKSAVPQILSLAHFALA
jgi:hypothetical protein